MATINTDLEASAEIILKLRPRSFWSILTDNQVEKFEDVDVPVNNLKVACHFAWKLTYSSSVVVRWNCEAAGCATRSLSTWKRKEETSVSTCSRLHGARVEWNYRYRTRHHRELYYISSTHRVYRVAITLQIYHFSTEHEDEEDNKRKPWPSTFAGRVVAFFGFVLFSFSSWFRHILITS